MPDPNDTLIEDDVWIACPPAWVFAAVTRPQELAGWWPKAAEADPRLGGRLVFTWFAGGTLETRFTRFEPDHAVAFEFGREHVELELAPEQGGTRFRVRHRCPHAGAIHVAQAWGFLKASLKAYLEAGFDVRGTAPEA